MPLDLYHLRSPIENVWEKLAVKVFVVILLSERDSPKSSIPCKTLWGTRLSSAKEVKFISPLET